MDKGDIHKENNLTIGYLAQTTFENEHACVKEELETAFAKVKRIGKQLEEISEQMVYDHSETCLLYTSMDTFMSIWMIVDMAVGNDCVKILSIGINMS